jgi:hypothetical protein
MKAGFVFYADFSSTKSVISTHLFHMVFGGADACMPRSPIKALIAKASKHDALGNHKKVGVK